METKKICTLFCRRFDFSMLLWKRTALKMYMYLMGDDADCSFREVLLLLWQIWISTSLCISILCVIFLTYFKIVQL